MIQAFSRLFYREVLLSWRQGGAGWLVVVFYGLAAILYPLAVGPDLETLALIGPGVVWVAVLLSAILSLDRLYALDVEDGSMDLFVLSGTPLWLLAFTKSAAHWFNTLGPVLLITPVLAVVYNIPERAYVPLILALALGTPALSFLGSFAAALTSTVKRGGVLIPLLVLPLYIPTLIFGTSAVAEAIGGTGAEVSSLYFLAGLSAFSVALGPWASALAIRQTMD